ncbi:NADH dehydrogenase [ubiquinone] 1 alpha subcomplex subunit 2-like [Saccoglossus kowalevskii]|uniref:NADH dehydrogenase [ubiquinone] 1 alpha subcomplex subunit 2 n=1 Tax=Saccoglossus kowalevskii TaxID=10224 RepID=A0ABM0GKQ5_SACKO|nr:PREDICTED: NADH dehydrogenase [ubiquinone] 1 alpha subcomplex subunit 2-like [Saccoglossus kowalevskii]
MAASARRIFPAFVKEVRITLCQRSPSSQGTRDFIEKNYVSIKKQNPKFPVMIRECSGVQPKMFARYDFGREKQVSLANMSSDEVGKAMESLLTNA